MWINQPNYGQEQWERDRAEQARVEAEDRRNKYNEQVMYAIKNAPDLGYKYAKSIGLNPDNPGIADIINQVVSGISTSMPRDLETGNPHSYFSPDAFGQRFADFESRARRANTAQVRNAFGTGFESKLLPDSSIDSIVNDIINEQKGLASTKLDYQSKRGLFTPKGTEQASKSLVNQESAGRGTLTNLARGVLDKDRSAITDIVSKAGNAASSWMLGNDPFSISPYQQQINDRAAQEKAGFGGDVRAALGNTQLFDIPTIVSQAGVAQGADNLNFGSNPNARKRDQTKRGLGSTGGGF